MRRTSSSVLLIVLLSYIQPSCRVNHSDLSESSDPSSHEISDPDSEHWRASDSLDSGPGGTNAESKSDPNSINETVDASVSEKRSVNDVKQRDRNAVGPYTKEGAISTITAGRAPSFSVKFGSDCKGGGLGVCIDIDTGSLFDFRGGLGNSNGNSFNEKDAPAERASSSGVDAPRASPSGVRRSESISYSSIDDFRSDVESQRDDLKSQFSDIAADSISNSPNRVASNTVRSAVGRYNAAVKNFKSHHSQFNSSSYVGDGAHLTSPVSFEGRQIRQAYSYANSAKNTIANSNLDDKTSRISNIETAEALIELADQEYVDGSPENATSSLHTALVMIDTALAFVPGVSLTKDVLSLLGGTNIITGEALGDLDCGLIVAGLLAPSIMSGSMKASSKFIANVAKSKLGTALKSRIISGVRAATSFFADQGKALSKLSPHVANLSAISKKIGPQYAALARPALRKMQANGVKVSTATAVYVGRLAKSGKYSANEIVALGKTRAYLEAKMMGLKGYKASIMSTRAVPETILSKEGKVIAINTDATVYDKHIGMLGGGRWHMEGTSAIYAAEGSGPNAWATAFNELKKTADVPLRLDHVEIQFDNLLDLTNAGIVDGKLGLKFDDFVKLESDGGYDVTQMIGDIARDLGFDGIKVESAANRGNANLIKFLD